MAVTTSNQRDVFINCPFDEDYQPLFYAMVFAVLASGFRPRSALEIIDSGQLRLEKLFDLIGQCPYGIHDISRTEPDPINNLPRFNMPLELGIDLGCRRFGSSTQRQKVLLIMDTERHRYQKFISDLAGQDPCAHQNIPKVVIGRIRDWLSSHHPDALIPGGQHLFSGYRTFQRELIQIRSALKLDKVLNYRDYVNVVKRWIVVNGA